MSGTVTAQRVQLGNELRHARQAAGLTQQDAAGLIKAAGGSCSQAKITRIESGTVSMKPKELRALLQGYNILGERAETLLDLASTAGRRRGQWTGYRTVIPEHFRMFTDLEPAALEILAWEDGRFHGLLQSECYMLQQFVTAGADRVNWRVQQRLERQRIFMQENAPECTFVVGEAAFHRAPGGFAPHVMADQMEHLLRVIDRYEHVKVYVLPFDAELSWTQSDFTIMRFDESIKDFAYVAYPSGSIYVDDPEAFQCFVDAYVALRSAVLEREESRVFIERVVKKYDER